MKAGLELLSDAANNLPSPPGIGAEIVRMANDPYATVSSVADLISKDPAIASKVLRIVNSAMYAKPREIENLQQAIVIMGLNAAMSLALSFSLIDSMGNQRGGGLDYGLYWRRSLLSAMAAKVIGEAVGETAQEELFLAALLQDIGMLALDNLQPDFYAQLDGRQIDQAKLLDYEFERIEADHSEVGGMLLRQWCLPDRTSLTVEVSHDPHAIDERHELGRFVRCVALSGPVADIFLVAPDDRDYEQLAQLADSYLHADQTRLQNILERVAEIIPEAEALFSTRLVQGGNTGLILAQAREALMIRNLQAWRTVEKLEDTAESLHSRTRFLEDMNKRDALTGVFNRRHLETCIEGAFKTAQAKHEPLSVVFTDLDRFKNINDTYGHAAGDQLLKAAARILARGLRDSDVVARYGGEEFVILLPGSAEADAVQVCDRIQRCFHETTHVLSDSRKVPLTISMGIATHGDGLDFATADDLVRAADSAVYAAKQLGRDRNILYRP